METSAPRRFRLAPHAEPAWRHWDGEYVVHHALSNDTHRLSDAAGRLLVHLARFGEKDAESLALDCELRVAEVEAILSELATLGLVA